MGIMQPTQRHTFKSTNDLTGKQYYLVALDTSNANSIVLANAQTAPAIGVLLNEPTAGDTAEVLLTNRTVFVVAHASFSIGAALTAYSDGTAIATTTAAEEVIGIALEAAAAAGDRVEMMITDKFYHA